MTLAKTKSQLLIGITILFVSCTRTTTKTKDRVFTDTDKVKKELISIIRAEHINLAGKEIASNGGYFKNQTK